MCRRLAIPAVQSPARTERIPQGALLAAFHARAQRVVALLSHRGAPYSSPSPRQGVRQSSRTVPLRTPAPPRHPSPRRPPVAGTRWPSCRGARARHLPAARLPCATGARQPRRISRLRCGARRACPQGTRRRTNRTSAVGQQQKFRFATTTMAFSGSPFLWSPRQNRRGTLEQRPRR